jgi:putative Mg2+ transporter-C (MgtC) family protein
MLIHGDWTEIALRLLVGTLVGMALGFDREWRGFDAGLRTHGLVALSSAMLTISSIMMFEELHERQAEGDPLRVVQGLAQAIGFIAGGLIFVRGSGVKNMTTAASVWTACVAGIAAGAGQYVLLGVASLLAILLLTLVGFAERFFPHAEERPDKGKDKPVSPKETHGRN